MAAVALLTGVGLAGVGLAGSHFARPLTAQAWVLAAGTVVALISGVFHVWPAVRRHPTLDDAAERLDLAAADHNAVATALSLTRSKDDSPMAAVAIERGIEALDRHRHTWPSAAITTLRHGRVWPALMGGVVLATLGMWLPAIFDARRASAVEANPTFAFAQPAARPEMPTAAKLEERSKPADRNSASTDSVSPQFRPAAAAANSPVTANPAQATDAAAASASDAGQSAGASDMSVAAQAKKPDAAGRPAGAASPPQPKSPAAQRAAAAQQKSSMSQSDSDGQSNSGAAPKAAGSKADGSSGEKSGDKNSDSQQGGGNSESDSPSPPPGDEPGQSPGGSQGSDNPNAPDAPGSGNGRSSSSSESGGGNGQSSGQSPPKKARGVAPLLLGARQADLLQGRTLPGPDERTRIQLPPVHQPGRPDAAAAVNASQSPEPATGVYRVPPAKRAAVDAYFRQFHQDPAPPN